jgi:hypothetical protein
VRNGSSKLALAAATVLLGVFLCNIAFSAELQGMRAFPLGQLKPGLKATGW